MSDATPDSLRVSVDDVIHQLKAGPSGPKVAAFFDFDGTLIDGYSAGALYEHRARNLELGPDELIRTLAATLGGPLEEGSFEQLMLRGTRGWTGRTHDELMELGEQLFTTHVAGALHHGAWRLVRAHQNLGHTVVIATSATAMQVMPMARELGVEHVLCTKLETVDDVLTGRLDGRTLWGPGKLAAAREFARRKRIPLNDCHAYANGDEDVPLLDAVGSPHPVNPAPLLARHADEHGWRTIRLPGKSSRLNPMPWIRTTALIGSFAASVGAGAVAGVLTQDRRGGVDLATSLFGRVGGVVGNIAIDVIGEQHAARRPAVFFINHQSTLIDALVTSRVIQRGFTVVAKAELREAPVLGSFLDMAGVAFVDRTDTAKAISGLQSAVEKLRSGVSIAMAPEGTRSLSPRVGPFKKGGFHLARDAGVPIVPVVIRNAGEIMWRNASVAQEGTIEVVVHEPVPTEHWQRTDVDPWLTRMRRLYVDTLDDWPGDAAGAQWSEAIAEAARVTRP
ncbi:MAG: putative phosphoserine phosphatase / 1-acylglycerol-3-phosphate O-acyltransferase [Mycobacterium sp.]|jgi:putative phosphoserine phosphatase/1-acylglycerol-3-phosphate O-acyltransferase|nr:putative phosphoserine phosphatase / 1-acylglycerol-3-phosphate O-acyltransferase [Mycobacterium sp.]